MSEEVEHKYSIINEEEREESIYFLIFMERQIAIMKNIMTGQIQGREIREMEENEKMLTENVEWFFRLIKDKFREE